MSRRIKRAAVVLGLLALVGAGLVGAEKRRLDAAVDAFHAAAGASTLAELEYSPPGPGTAFAPFMESVLDAGNLRFIAGDLIAGPPYSWDEPNSDHGAVDALVDGFRPLIEAALEAGVPESSFVDRSEIPWRPVVPEEAYELAARIAGRLEDPVEGLPFGEEFSGNLTGECLGGLQRTLRVPGRGSIEHDLLRLAALEDAQALGMLEAAEPLGAVDVAAGLLVQEQRWGTPGPSFHFELMALADALYRRAHLHAVEGRTELLGRELDRLWALAEALDSDPFAVTLIWRTKIYRRYLLVLCVTAANLDLESLTAARARLDGLDLAGELRAALVAQGVLGHRGFRRARGLLSEDDLLGSYGAEHIAARLVAEPTVLDWLANLRGHRRFLEGMVDALERLDRDGLLVCRAGDLTEQPPPSEHWWRRLYQPDFAGHYADVAVFVAQVEAVRRAACVALDAAIGEIAGGEVAREAALLAALEQFVDPFSGHPFERVVREDSVEVLRSMGSSIAAGGHYEVTDVPLDRGSSQRASTPR